VIGVFSLIGLVVSGAGERTLRRTELKWSDDRAARLTCRDLEIGAAQEHRRPGRAATACVVDTTTEDRLLLPRPPTVRSPVAARRFPTFGGRTLLLRVPAVSSAARRSGQRWYALAGHGRELWREGVNAFVFRRPGLDGFAEHLADRYRPPLGRPRSAESLTVIPTASG
jgi:hypothetical protein